MDGLMANLVYLWDRAKCLEVSRQLLHSLQQASRLSILSPLDSPLQLVCMAPRLWVKRTPHTCMHAAEPLPMILIQDSLRTFAS